MTINRIGRVMESNLCYPSRLEYIWIAVLDKDFVSEELLREFQAERIANKYVILMPNGRLWYQHDNSTWLLEKK